MQNPIAAGRTAFLWLTCLATAAVAADSSTGKERDISGGRSAAAEVRQSSAAPVGGQGYRFMLTNGVSRVSVVVVGGTPYEMGWHFGRLMKAEINQFIPATVEGFKKELQLDDEKLDVVWTTTAAYTDDRVKQEILGVAAGAGLPSRTVQHAHCLPLLMPYSCSSLAAWGKATADSHLYQTRNLDWSLEAGAHEFPVILVCLPAKGHAQVLPTFAGVVGANCGMNTAGVVLSEMGDSPETDMPYNLRAPHFTTWFRTILYDTDSLASALKVFEAQPQTKRYHFVFGDGQHEKRAVKLVTQSAEPPPLNVQMWRDEDPKDELAPNVLPCVVYQDEGRGAFPALKKEQGKLDGEKMLAIARTIPIKGGNVLIAVFDATTPRVWVSYAGGGQEAYQRPAVFLDLATLDGDHDGKPDLQEGGQDRDGNGVPDFLDPAPAAAR
jgi:hypothetical protein